jgi:hypothetical protein
MKKKILIRFDANLLRKQKRMRNILEPYYKLFIEGMEPVEGNRKDLLRLAEKSDKPWEIYAYHQSAIEFVFNMQSSITIQKIREAKRLKTLGRGKQNISREIHMGIELLNQVLKNLDLL